MSPDIGNLNLPNAAYYDAFGNPFAVDGKALTASGVAWEDYGDYLNDLALAGYRFSGDERDVEVTAGIVGEWIYAPGLREMGLSVPRPEGKLISAPVGDVEVLAVSMLFADGLWLPGEERAAALSYGQLADWATAENVLLLGPALSWLLQQLFGALLAGAWGSSIRFALAMIAGILAGKIFSGGEETPIYLGKRLIAVIKGDVVNSLGNRRVRGAVHGRTSDRVEVIK